MSKESIDIAEADGIVTPRTAAAALHILFSGKHHDNWMVVAVDDDTQKNIDVSAQPPYEYGLRTRRVTIELQEAQCPPDRRMF